MATRPVAVAVDGSKSSLSAVEWAARTARLHGAPLRIVAAPSAAPAAYAVDGMEETTANARRGIAARALGAAIGRAIAIAPDLDIRTALPSGSPPSAVAEAGRDAAILVVGAHGAGGDRAKLLGSVTSYAVAHAACPVVVVRGSTPARRHQVVVGIQDGKQSDDALAFALEEASARGAELTAVHAWSRCHEGLAIPAGDAPARAAADLAESLDSWRGKYPEVRIRSQVVHGRTAWVLAQYSVSAELVVLGRSESPDGRDLTPIQHAVLSHARGPVAVVPGERGLTGLPA